VIEIELDAGEKDATMPGADQTLGGHTRQAKLCRYDFGKRFVMFCSNRRGLLGESVAALGFDLFDAIMRLDELPTSNRIEDRRGLTTSRGRSLSQKSTFYDRQRQQ
jgi:hypothetical protein